MRQKVTHYPGRDVTVTVWVGRAEALPSPKEIFKEMVFNLTELYIHDRRLGKNDYLRQLNAIIGNSW